MIDLLEKEHCPTLEELGDFVRNPLFLQFCQEIMGTYQCQEKIEYSSCNWERGWNVKFKKAGKSLCTIYPRENYFTVLVVVGKKEKPFAEKLLPDCTLQLRTIYHKTQEGNGQRWLMIDLEDREELYEDVMQLIAIRRKGKQR